MLSQEITNQGNNANVSNETMPDILSDKQVLANGHRETPGLLLPTATGDARITIIKHDFYRKIKEGNTAEPVGIEILARNILDESIGSALFEAHLYGLRGNLLDIVKHKAFDFKPNTNRRLYIIYPDQHRDKITNYHVKVVETKLAPKPTVTGNSRIAILNHSIMPGIEGYRGQPGGVTLSIRNVSDVTIATLIFEAVLYDIEGNILDTVRHRETELRPATSRSIIIPCPSDHVSVLRSYDIRLCRAITADEEKVQLRTSSIQTTVTGTEEVRGVVKNISSVKTDTAIIATFYNSRKEDVGTKVLILRDIEPGNIRQFRFLFKPQEGDMVRSCSFKIGEILESNIS